MHYTITVTLEDTKYGVDFVGETNFTQISAVYKILKYCGTSIESKEEIQHLLQQLKKRKAGESSEVFEVNSPALHSEERSLGALIPALKAYIAEMR